MDLVYPDWMLFKLVIASWAEKKINTGKNMLEEQDERHYCKLRVAQTR